MQVLNAFDWVAIEVLVNRLAGCLSPTISSHHHPNARIVEQLCEGQLAPIFLAICGVHGRRRCCSFPTFIKNNNRTNYYDRRAASVFRPAN
jgi:hypothetical protein